MKKHEELTLRLINAGESLDILSCIEFLSEAIEINHAHLNLIAPTLPVTEEIKRTTQLVQANILLGILSSGAAISFLNKR